MLPSPNFVHNKHVDTVVHDLFMMAQSLAATTMSRSFLRGQGRAGQGRAGQGRAGQGRAGQGRAGQGRAGLGVSPDGTGHGFKLCWRYACADIL